MSQNSEVMVIRNTGNLPQVIEENSLFSYFEKIRKFPVLSENEETRLIRDFKENGDLTAAQKLITSHLRLAAKIALTYRRYGLPMADIVSEANIGLMQAVKKFDLDKKVRLATYAIWWIKAAINDYILRSWLKLAQSPRRKNFFITSTVLRRAWVFMKTASLSRRLSKASRESWSSTKRTLSK